VETTLCQGLANLDAALQLAFGPQLIVAIPLGGWLWPPHQPAVHLPYDPASDMLYQSGHH